MSDKVFRVCAIAKDEAPYLAEWVFHHHYFGFNSIVVYVNRTTDSSLKVLKKLSDEIPGLEYEVIDWVDFCGPEIGSKIQTIAYAKDIARCKELSVDYWIPLDIDEFWTPADFETKIDEHVISISKEQEAVSYPWYCEIGCDQPFSSFTPESRFHFGTHVKTLSPKPWENIKTLRIHCPTYSGLRVLDPSGNKAVFQKDRPQLLDRKYITKQPAYIVHRMNRSELEYFAMLKKGRPKSKYDLKTNRSGYKGVDDDSRRKFKWPKSAYRNYTNRKLQLIDNLKIEDIILHDKEKIMKDADFVLNKLSIMLKSDFKDRELANKLVSGTSYTDS